MSTRKAGKSRGEVTLPPITEAEVTAQVLDAARHLGIVLERQNTGGMTNARGQYVTFGQAGNPDFTGTLPGGRRLGVEIKRPGNRPTDEQLAKLRALNDAGAVGLWTDDAEAFFRLMPHVISGVCWVEIDEAGTPWITDEGERPCHAAH